MPIITNTQARAAKISPDRLVATAVWNENAAKAARGRKDQASSDRHLSQASQLRDLAVELTQD